VEAALNSVISGLVPGKEVDKGTRHATEQRWDSPPIALFQIIFWKQKQLYMSLTSLPNGGRDSLSPESSGWPDFANSLTFLGGNGLTTYLSGSLLLVT